MSSIRRHSMAAAVLAVAGTAGYLTARRSLRAELAATRRAAMTDALTGIANRAGLTAVADRVIATAHRAGHAVVVALVDLVGFKAVNDRHGHDAGDHILTVVAGRLASVAGLAGVAARLGGDEFALVTTSPAGGVEDGRWLEGWLPSAHARVTVPAPYAGGRLAVGATIGATLAGPGRSIGAWLTAADHAMYEARANRSATAVSTVAPSAVGRGAGRCRELVRPTSPLSVVDMHAGRVAVSA